MRLRLIKTIIFCCIFTILLSGCSLIDFFSAESLLKAPKITGENAELQLAFEKEVGKDISLFNPISGEYRSSYIVFDINDDNQDEAIVFYSQNSNKTVVHMNLLTKNDGEWISVADIIGSGTEVYKVDFFDIDDNDNLEIAVTWSADDSKREKTLSVYRVSKNIDDNSNVLSSVATLLIADYVCFDCDNDSVNELLYIYFNVNEGQVVTSARLLKFDSNQQTFDPVSDVSFHTQFASVMQILCDKQDNNYSIYIDCLLTDNMYTTELVVYNTETEVLTIPVIDGVHLSSLAIRKYNKVCQDFDSDGSINVPFELKTKPSYVFGAPAEQKSQFEFIKWCTVESDKLIENGNFVYNGFDGYLMNINELHEKYYFTYDYENKAMQVRMEDVSAENNILVSITYKEISESSELFQDDNTTYEIIVLVTDLGKSVNLDANKLKESIISL